MTQQIIKWDRERITRELTRLHRGGLDISSNHMRRTRLRLHSAANYWFGTYSKAVEAAGIDYADVSHAPLNNWSRKEIVRQIRRRKGKPLHISAMIREEPALVVAAYRYFGTYRKAVEAAGIDYLSVRVRPPKIWNPRRILRELKQEKGGESGLWQGEMKRNRPTLVGAARRYFGSYRRAAKAAGFTSAALQPPPYRRWSPNAVVAELQRLHRQRERLNPSHLHRHRTGLIRASARGFGSYRKAVAAAGIEYTSVARIVSKHMPPEQVIARLAALHEQGKDIRYLALERSEPRTLYAARNRFGTYRAAVEAAGIAYPPLKPIKHWTEPLILNTLRDLRRAGADLRYAKMKRNYLPLYEASRYYFGFYTNAVREAGIDYDGVVQEQLDRRRKAGKARVAGCRA